MTTAREAILEYAVRHFADHGYGGASLREILRDAGVNAAAAHYHFGSKEAVYREAVTAYLSRLSEERKIALQSIEANLPAEQRLERLIRAYIEPHIRLCSEPAAHGYVRLLARFITEDDELTRRIYTEALEPVRSMYAEALAKTLPQLSMDDLQRLFSFMVVLMATAPANSSYQSMAGQPAWPREPERLVDQLVKFISAGFMHCARERGSAKGRRSRTSRRLRRR